MQSVTVAKDSLIKALTANRAKHLIEYNKAVVEFRQAARKLLQDALGDVVADDAPIGLKEPLKHLYVHLDAPRQYLKEYDKALRMLDMSIKGEIELDSHEFSSYVDDDWDWKDTFSASNSTYSTLMSSKSAKAYKGGPIG